MTSPPSGASSIGPTGESMITGTQSTPSGAQVSSPHVDMKSPIPTALGASLESLRLDPQNLPPIEKLEPKTLRSVMKLMAGSLGIKCEGCHEENDFAAPTRRKKIAMHMWDDFVVKLAMADGSPLFCDSCHRGRIEQLDRRDQPMLSAWMDANFVTKLTRKDGQPQTCETCHVDMNMRFLSDWGH